MMLPASELLPPPVAAVVHISIEMVPEFVISDSTANRPADFLLKM